MNICFLNDIGVLGGGEIWVLRACDFLRKQGCGVVVACPRESALQRECVRRALTHYAYAPGGLESEETGLAQFLCGHDIDILYCTVIGGCCEARALEHTVRLADARRNGGKTAIILKAGLPPIGGLSSQHYGCGAGPSVRRLHVVADSIKQSFLNWEPGLEGGFVKVFREGVDLGCFRKNGTNCTKVRQRWQIPDDHLIVTCVGRLDDGMKGQGVLLRSIQLLRDAHRNVTFVLAGEGPDRNVLEELAGDCGIESAVRFTGHLDDVAELLTATSVLCHPSLHDGLPNAIVEAMAMGIPVVASRIGAIPELVADGVSGALVRPNDPHALASALASLLRKDAAERCRMGEQARARVRADWNLHDNLTAWHRELEEEARAYAAQPHAGTAPPRPPVPAKVLFALTSVRTGGEETELAILARYLDRRRFPMSVLSFHETAERAPALEKLAEWRIPVDTVCHRIPAYSDKVDYLLTKIREEQIRIVVACHDPQLEYEAFAHLRLSECRLVEHGGLLEDVTKIPKDRTARYIAVSPAIRAAAAQCMPRPASAVFIPSMVDTDEFEKPEYAPAREWCRQYVRGACLEAAGLPHDAIVIVFVGRFDPRKRIVDFIAAARELRACPTFFLIVGGPDALQFDYSLRLQEEGRGLIEMRRLVITGPRGHVAGLLCASDILVLPSVGEGMAHVINEAGAAGLAVVASDDGAAREQLEGGKCGILIEPGNVAQLVEALRTLVSDRQLRTVLGGRLRERVHRLYAARVVVEQWNSLLADLIHEMDSGPDE